MARVARAAEAVREVMGWCFAGESSHVIYLGLPRTVSKKTDFQKGKFCL